MDVGESKAVQTQVIQPGILFKITFCCDNLSNFLPQSSILSSSKSHGIRKFPYFFWIIDLLFLKIPNHSVLVPFLT